MLAWTDLEASFPLPPDSHSRVGEVHQRNIVRLTLEALLLGNGCAA